MVMLRSVGVKYRVIGDRFGISIGLVKYFTDKYPDYETLKTRAILEAVRAVRKARNKQLPVKVCKCGRRYLKTEGEEQKKCLYCLRKVRHKSEGFYENLFVRPTTIEINSIR